MKKIFVGNLSRQTTDGGLQAAFSQFGAVRSVMVMMDRMTGEPRGFAFVEMENDTEAAEAINQLNGKELDGRKLTVNEARPKTDKPRGPGGGGGGRGGYGGGGGRGGYGGGGRGGYGGEGGGRGGRGGYR